MLSIVIIWYICIQPFWLSGEIFLRIFCLSWKSFFQCFVCSSQPGVTRTNLSSRDNILKLRPRFLWRLWIYPWVCIFGCNCIELMTEITTFRGHLINKSRYFRSDNVNKINILLGGKFGKAFHFISLTHNIDCLVMLRKSMETIA